MKTAQEMRQLKQEKTATEAVFREVQTFFRVNVAKMPKCQNAIFEIWALLNP